MVLGNKGKNVKILSWYNNECSFACRFVDLIKFIYKNNNQINKRKISEHIK